MSESSIPSPRSERTSGERRLAGALVSRVSAAGAAGEEPPRALALPVLPRFVSHPPRLSPDLAISLAERRLLLESRRPQFETERLRTKSAAPFRLQPPQAASA
jgi:hypothetical protein